MRSPLLTREEHTPINGKCKGPDTGHRLAGHRVWEITELHGVKLRRMRWQDIQDGHWPASRLANPPCHSRSHGLPLHQELCRCSTERREEHVIFPKGRGGATGEEVPPVRRPDRTGGHVTGARLKRDIAAGASCGVRPSRSRLQPRGQQQQWRSGASVWKFVQYKKERFGESIGGLW